MWLSSADLNLPSPNFCRYLHGRSCGNTHHLETQNTPSTQAGCIYAAVRLKNSHSPRWFAARHVHREVALDFGYPRPIILSVFSAPLPILPADNTACQTCLLHLRPALHIRIDFALECGKCSFTFQLKNKTFGNKQIDLVTVVWCRDRGMSGSNGVFL